jgi:hypothetical protein
MSLFTGASRPYSIEKTNLLDGPPLPFVSRDWFAAGAIGVQYHLDVGTKQDVIKMASRSDVPDDNKSHTNQAGLKVEYSVDLHRCFAYHRRLRNVGGSSKD